MMRIRFLSILLPVVLLGCTLRHPSSAAEASGSPSEAEGTFGVLLMAHGGPPEWNRGVLDAVKPLQGDHAIEVAFGMADAASIQEAVGALEARGVRKIGVVRLFVSGESWYDRTERILGLQPGAPVRKTTRPQGHGEGHGGRRHRMEFWRIRTRASFSLTRQGLVEAEAMGTVLADRARALSRAPEKEDLLILAHGPGDDAENRRWIADLEARAAVVRESLPFRRIRVETLREDWPDKRKDAERRIRAFVKRAEDEGGTAIVIPFRVHGFGPYAKVLEGLDYVSDGKGLIPHPKVTEWIAGRIRALRKGSFRKPVD